MNLWNKIKESIRKLVEDWREDTWRPSNHHCISPNMRKIMRRNPDFAGKLVDAACKAPSGGTVTIKCDSGEVITMKVY